MRVVPAAGRHCRGCTSPGRSTPCVDALREEPRRQPRLAATNSRPTQRSFAGQRQALQVDPRHAWRPSARNHGANQGWRLPTAGPHSDRLPASGRHYKQIHAMRGCSLHGTTVPTKVGIYNCRARSHTKKRRPCGRRLGLLQYSVEQARRYFAAAGALSFIIASRAALNGLPSYQFGQRSPPASSLPTPYISCRSSTVPSSFQVAASNSSFGPW